MQEAEMAMANEWNFSEMFNSLVVTQYPANHNFVQVVLDSHISTHIKLYCRSISVLNAIKMHVVDD